MNAHDLKLATSPARNSRSRAATLRVLGALGFGFAAATTATPALGASRYVFATFTGDAAAQEKLRIYTSSDCLNFTLLADTQYGGATGVLRDPSIMKHEDGKYYIAHTVQSWTTTSSYFAIATSTDLRKWTEVTTVPNGVAGATQGFTWAPEWFKDDDGSIHLIVSVSTTTASASFRSYLYTARDSTLTSFSGPTALGIGPNYIDTFVVKAGTTYHAFTKNESTKYIEHATASALTGPWKFVGSENWAGWGSGKEGPALVKLESGKWRLFMDLYGAGGFLYADSADLNSWSSHSTVPGGLSGVVRHGTILREELTATGGSGSGGTNGAGSGAGGSAGGTSAAGSPSGGDQNSSGIGGGGTSAGRSNGGNASAGTSNGGATNAGTSSTPTGGSPPTGGAPASSAGFTASGGSVSSNSAGGSAPSAGTSNAGAGGTSSAAAGSVNSNGGGAVREPDAGAGCSFRASAHRGALGSVIAAAAAAMFFARRSRRNATPDTGR